MRTISKLLLTSLVAIQLATVSVQAASLYQIDNNNIGGVVNASDGTETLDNWFGNVFTTIPGGTLINEVDLGVFTTSPGSIASVSLYRVTGAGGNPALGATRLYTQAFTPLTGDGTNAFLQAINLTSPVSLNVGDTFLVSILIRSVIGAPPNDVYPFLLDTSGSSTGSYWGRSGPNLFNIDNLSGVVPTSQALAPGGFIPGPAHNFIRAIGVPEPTSLALAGLGLAALLISRRHKGASTNGK
jgi:PEP-CTERM putative exosortase interaction domain